MGKLKFDWDSESFDLFFQKQLQGKKIDDESGLPKELLFKLLHGGDNPESISTSKMNGLEKIYILWKALGKQVYIVVDDEDDGIGMEEFLKVKKRNKLLPPHIAFSDNGVTHFPASFIKADKELSELFSIYNLACNSSTYRYLLGIKNRTPNRISKWKNEMKYINRYTLNYEAVKRNAAKKLGLELAELYVLMYLYDDEEKQAAPLYDEKFYHVCGAGSRQIRTAFSNLHHKGFIHKKGTTTTARYRIGALGIEKINEFFKKYATNL